MSWPEPSLSKGGAAHVRHKIGKKKQCIQLGASASSGHAGPTGHITGNVTGSRPCRLLRAHHRRFVRSRHFPGLFRHPEFAYRLRL
jgi:hypothetical protein